MKTIQGIYAICDENFRGNLSHQELGRNLLRGGVRILQLRMKDAKDLQQVWAAAQALKQLKQEFDYTLIINDYVEVALELPADGVHLGQDDIPLAQARNQIGPDLLLGYSSHSLAEARQAESEGADYVALGAVFPTPTKGEGHPVVGLATLQQVVKELKVPVVAIGGINQENLHQVAQTGVAAAAMISALTQTENIPDRARWFVDHWKKP